MLSRGTLRLIALAACVGLLTSHGQGQIAHYKLDTDGSDSAGGHHGTLSATGATIVPTSMIGGGALSVDAATNGRVSLIANDGSTNFNSLGNNFSISAWVLPTSGGRFFGSDRTQSTSRNFSFGISSGNLLLTTWGVLDYTATAAAAVPTGQYSHVGVVLNSSNDATYYVNGVAVQTVNHTAPGNTGSPLNPFFINPGSSNNATPSGLYTGLIDDLAFFNTSLGATDFALINGLGQVGGIGIEKPA